MVQAGTFILIFSRALCSRNRFLIFARKAGLGLEMLRPPCAFVFDDEGVIHRFQRNAQLASQGAERGPFPEFALPENLEHLAWQALGQRIEGMSNSAMPRTLLHKTSRRNYPETAKGIRRPEQFRSARCLMADMLELRHVTKKFTGITAVDNVSFTARPGEVTGYLGPNGSGKSTTMKMITGLLEPSGGEIAFDGAEIRQNLIAFKRRMGYVPEEPQLYGHLSALEYLAMVAQLRELPEKSSAERIDGMLRAFALHGDRHSPISAYSKGMRQKVLLIAALLHDPALVLLDEPFSGLDVASALVLRSLIQELAARGKVVLFSSHDLETVERVCSRVVILHRGRVVADDSIANLRSLMALPTLEAIFAELAVEQDPAAVAREIAALVRG